VSYLEHPWAIPQIWGPLRSFRGVTAKRWAFFTFVRSLPGLPFAAEINASMSVLSMCTGKTIIVRQSVIIARRYT
jgi:hypothetical protein